MEGFDAARVRAYLDVPDRFALPVIIPTGYASDEPPAEASPRFDPGDVFFADTFGVSFRDVRLVDDAD